jgi:hypothetical protein
MKVHNVLQLRGLPWAGRGDIPPRKNPILTGARLVKDGIALIARDARNDQSTAVMSVERLEPAVRDALVKVLAANVGKTFAEIEALDFKVRA